MFATRRPDYTGFGPKGYKRSDERIYEDVCELLARHGYIDATEIEVSVSQGVVTLKGSVEDRPMKRRAEHAVERIAGVRDIRNELDIKRTWVERMIDAAGGEEAVHGDGLLGSLPPNSNWRGLI